MPPLLSRLSLQKQNLRTNLSEGIQILYQASSPKAEPASKILRKLQLTLYIFGNIFLQPPITSKSSNPPIKLLLSIISDSPKTVCML